MVHTLQDDLQLGDGSAGIYLPGTGFIPRAGWDYRSEIPAARGNIRGEAKSQTFRVPLLRGGASSQLCAHDRDETNQANLDGRARGSPLRQRRRSPQHA